MRLIFMGTPDFAVPCFEALADSPDLEVAAVFTQPDKPKGRGYTLMPPPVKQAAVKRNIPVYQPKTLRDEETLEIIKRINPDAIAVVAYGKLIPKSILSLPKYGCINIHASLLPKYRGAAPIQWALLNGETETGVTSMQMDEGLDTGDILLKAEVPIGENETYGELHDKLSAEGAGLLLKTLKGLENAALTPCKQGETTTEYASMIDKSLCRIDWNEDSLSVHNKVRALSPTPAAFALLNGRKVKIFKTELSGASGKPGEILSTAPLTVACGTGSVKILELQLEGKKRMDAKSFLLGHKLDATQRFD